MYPVNVYKADLNLFVKNYSREYPGAHTQILY